MTNAPDKKKPQLITTEVLTKANLLGIGLLILFAIGAGMVYLLLGLTGWDGAVRILAALLASPFIVSSILAFWWLSRRSTPIEDNNEQQS